MLWRLWRSFICLEDWWKRRRMRAVGLMRVLPREQPREWVFIVLFCLDCNLIEISAVVQALAFFFVNIDFKLQNTIEIQQNTSKARKRSLKKEKEGRIIKQRLGEGNKRLLTDKGLFMNQQKQQTPTKPFKSLSARNFYKTNRPREASHKQHHTLQAESNQAIRVGQGRQSKGQPKSARNVPVRTKDISFLQPQHLYTQNIMLKGRLNTLSNQLMLERVKHHQNTKHLYRMKKEVEVQFQDDKYIDMSRNQSKLIEGLKHQYQKVKLKYQDKCRQYNQLLRRYEVSGGEEYRFHCEALEAENRKLRGKFEILLQTQNGSLLQNHKQRAKQQEGAERREEREQQRKKVMNAVGLRAEMICLQQNGESLQQRIQHKKAKLGHLRETLQSKNNKIDYLNKLLIFKDNDIHQTALRQRKLAKQSKELHFLNQELQAQLSNIREMHSQELAMVREREKVKSQTEKSIFLKQIQQKDTLIEKLDHDLKYLNTILSYIKTGEDQQPKFNPLSKKNSYKDPTDLLYNLEQSLSSVDAINSPTVRQRVKTLFESGFRDPSPAKPQVNTETLKKALIRASDSELGLSQMGESSQSANEQQEGLIESRIVKRSYLKHSSEAVRMKQVKKSMLEYFREELIYRLIYYRLPTDQVKSYLSFTEEEKNNLSRRERRWKAHYVSLQEVREKLQNHPFGLSEEKALLLARYIVEDATKDELFYHPENQVERSIAKSILRAFIGEYVVPDEQKAREELSELFANSGRNLKSALTSLAPEGTISAFKLMEISRGIQAEFSQPCRNFILSQLAFKSPGGLNALNYSLLFQDDL